MNETPIRVAQVMGIMNRGGVEAVVMNYYRAIDRSRVQFDFFVDKTSAFPQREEIERLGGRCYLVSPYAQPLRYVATLTRLFRQNGYAIVHSQINTMGVFPLFAAWLAGARVRICHNHSTSHPGEGKKTLLKYLLRPFARLFATDYFACGESAARWMFGARLTNRRMVTLLPNAIDLSQYRYSPNDRFAVRKELGIGADAFVVGHIGRFTYAKNHAFLLRAFQSLLRLRPNATLILAGDGELMESTKALAHQLGIESHVRFLGARGDANRLYSAMDVFCLPSFYEGGPIVLVEALANGLSSVSSPNIMSELSPFKQVEQLSLDLDATQWATALNGKTRSEKPPALLDELFDIQRTVVRLEAYYLTSIRD